MANSTYFADVNGFIYRFDEKPEVGQEAIYKGKVFRVNKVGEDGTVEMIPQKHSAVEVQLHVVCE